MALDIDQIEESGGDIAGEIKSDPEAAHLPIIFFSSTIMPEEVDGNEQRTVCPIVCKLTGWKALEENIEEISARS